LGAALLLIAPESRYPTALRVIGAVALAAAGSGALLGRERATRFISWWMARGHGFVRGWCAVAGIFGAFLVIAVA
jgi:hypothetical protein